MRYRRPRYAAIRQLEMTRKLNPEEMAELQLELGYADRALRIYDLLARQHPENEIYRTRRDWLVRLTRKHAAGEPTLRGYRVASWIDVD